MTAETQQFPVPDQAYTNRARQRAQQVRAETDQVRPGETFATIITAVFFSIGWTIGTLWRGVVFCCVAVRYGYRTGMHASVKAAQETPRHTRPGPGGTRIEE